MLNPANAIGSVQPREQTVAQNAIHQLLQINEMLSQLIERQHQFLARVLPPEPREASAPVPGKLETSMPVAQELDRLGSIISGKLDELAYVTSRLERIA